MNAYTHAALVIGDSLQNLVTGLGTDRDKSQAGRFGYRSRLTHAEIRSLYDFSPFAAKAVDLPAEDATADWRAWNGPKTAIEGLEHAERRLQLRTKVCAALKLAARDGGAALLIGMADDPHKPLEPAAVEKGGLRFVHVMPRWRLSCGPLDTDPWSPWFGQPSEFRISGGAGSERMLAIHPSRIIVLAGPGADPFEMGEPWGFSVFERMHDAVRDLTATLQGLAALVQEAKVDVIRVPGLSAGARDSNYREQVIARFGLAQTLKSIRNALVLDAAEEWDHKTLSFAGFPEVLDRLMTVLAGAANMPATLLFGRSPQGLNATGQSDLELYYKAVSRRQANEIGPALETLDECLIRSALGRRPRGLFYTWNSLWSMSETDMAKIRREHAAAAKDLADAGLVGRAALGRAVVNQAEQDGWLAGLGQFTSEAAKPVTEMESEG